MPKQWPQQSTSSPTALKVGPERTVTFLSESLGIKLNRGNDGIVRVLSVSPEKPGSEIARSGTIETGDIVREAAGVDIRRPITNIMWGDTIALVKIAPRPITMVVAKELSEIPPSVLEERQRAKEEESMSPAKISTMRGESKEDEEADMIMPSPAIGDESVRDSIAMANKKAAHARGGATDSPDHHVSESNDVSASLESMPSSSNANLVSLDHSGREGEAVSGASALGPPDLAVSSESVSCQEDDAISERNFTCIDVKNVALIDAAVSEESSTEEVDQGNAASKSLDADEDAICIAKVNASEEEAGSEDAIGSFVEVDEEVEDTEDACKLQEHNLSREQEIRAIGAEILFEKRADEAGVDEWSNLRWLSTSSERQLRFCKVVTRPKGARKGLFRSSEERPVRRKLAIYEKPNLMLLLRPPTSTAEVRKLLDLPDGVALEDEKNALRSFLVAESVIDPVTCMLRLSQLTTVTSVSNAVTDQKTPSRRRSYLELITPTDTISLSALTYEQEKVFMSNDRSLIGGPAFLQTASLENAIANALYRAHQPHADPDGVADVAWKHQVVQGTLHSYVISGNNVMLERGIKAALDVGMSSDETIHHVPSQIIDAQDESGRTALHYACLRRASQAVSLLTRAGASCSIPVIPGGFFPSHLSALVHDEKSLSVILSATYPQRPNANQFDFLGRTPMYLAVVEGKEPLGGGSGSDSLGRCLSALEAWGGQLLPNDRPVALRNPISILASRWAKEEIGTVLAHVRFRYPLEEESVAIPMRGQSLGAAFEYPIHSALITLLERIGTIGEDIIEESSLLIDDISPESAFVG